VNLVEFTNKIKRHNSGDTAHKVPDYEKTLKIPYFARMKNKQFVFNPSATALSLGVELELQVLDGDTLLLTPRANEIIDDALVDSLKKEFFQSTLEVISGICNNVHEVKTDLGISLKNVKRAAASRGLKISSTGTHPEADYRDRMITRSSRYDELTDRNQWLIRRMAVYGMHIHVGMTSVDHAIHFNNFLLHFVPHVLALSASSPFFQRMDTGLAAARPTVYESMPTSGMPYLVKDWKQFQKLYNALLKSQSIRTIRDLWWDVRPNPTLGTVELRICDEPARFTEALAIASFVHLLAHWFSDHAAMWGTSHKNFHQWMLRENKWRSIRYGLDAEILVQGKKNTVKLSDDILFWLEQVTPYEKQLAYESYITDLRTILRKGNSSQRQRAIFAETHELHDVTRFNVQEFETDLFNVDL
jgi:carboxylate-amine ligase